MRVRRALLCIAAGLVTALSVAFGPSSAYANSVQPPDGGCSYSVHVTEGGGTYDSYIATVSSNTCNEKIRVYYHGDSGVGTKYFYGNAVYTGTSKVNGDWWYTDPLSYGYQTLAAGSSTWVTHQTWHD